MILLATGAGTHSLIMFGMIFAVMYFFMIRPQIKKQKKEHEYRSALKQGDAVITIGGIYGKITDVKEDAFVIEVHGGTKLKVAKTAVSMTGDAGIEQK
jgi:preprotein translocase subunit YajC